MMTAEENTSEDTGRLQELRKFYRSKYPRIHGWLLDQFAEEALEQENEARAMAEAQGTLTDDEMSEQETVSDRDEYLDEEEDEETDGLVDALLDPDGEDEEECPDCGGNGNRFGQDSPCGEDEGACPTCYGKGWLVTRKGRDDDGR